MKNKKWTLCPNGSYAEIEEKLAAMAKQGWMVEYISGFLWRYRRITPKRCSFSITFCAEASKKAKNPTQAELFFRELCAHTGWEYAAGKEEMQIFYSEALHPVPIETDPLAAAEARKRVLLQKLRAGALSFFLLYGYAFLLVYRTCEGKQGPMAFLPVWALLLNAVCTALFELSVIFQDYKWYRKAKEAALQGCFLQETGASGLQVVLLGTVVVSCIFMLGCFWRF